MEIRNQGTLHRMWQEGLHEHQRATSLREEIARWDKNIAELKRTLGELEAEREAKVAAHQFASDQAHDLPLIVRDICAANGWDLPEVPDEVPVHQTTAFPAQNGSAPALTVPDRSAPPIDQTQVVPAQPSPPPADQPTPPGQPLHEADPVRRVDLSEAQGGANHG